MGWLRKLFGRNEPLTPEEMLAQAHAAQPEPVTVSPPASQNDFWMQVEDVFAITGRGLVATGRIKAGSITIGATINVDRGGTHVTSAVLDGIEMFRKTTKLATAGDNVGLLFKQLDRAHLAAGDVLTSASGPAA